MKTSPHDLTSIHNEDIPALTGLRGFAALWVFVMHACFGNINQYGFFPAFDHKLDWGYLEPLILAEGNLPVSLFFILSGFVMAHVYSRYFGQAIEFRSTYIFYIKRIARIYPTHLFITLILATAFYAGIWQPIRPLDIEDVWLSVLLLNVFQDPSVNIPAWSVSAEWLAYIACPFILFALSKIKAGKADILIILVLCAVYPYLFREFFCCTGTAGGGAIIKVMTDFFIGCILYRMYIHKIFVLQGKNANDILCVSLFGALWIIVYFAGSLEVNHTFLPFIFYYLANSSGFIKNFFSSRIMMFLGTVSYCLYLIHYPVLEIFTHYFSDYFYNPETNLTQGILWGFFIFMTTSVLLASTLLYYCIERPSRRFIVRKLGSSS